MNRLITIFFPFAFTANLHSQPYLIKNAIWQPKIETNYFLAPLFYGIKKNSIQLGHETRLKNELITKYGSTDSAYRQMLITGWNYFTIGMTDSAIINFNQAYLLDSTNLETFFAFGSIITYLDAKPNYELINHYHLKERVSSPWDLTAFFGNDSFLEELKLIKEKQIYKPNLSTLLVKPQAPYFVDSSKYITLKIKTDNSEGFYKMGRPGGPWTDYHFGTKKVMRTYTIVNGVECGQITAYHKNGKISAIFFKNNLGEIDGEFKVFDYNGELVRIEYWHKNKGNSMDSKIFKEWEEDGTITTDVINGEVKSFIWKDGQKALQK
jgi:hypothetical protein